MHHPTDRITHITVCFTSRGALVGMRNSSMAFDWLFICDDPSDVRDLRVKVVVEIDTP